MGKEHEVRWPTGPESKSDDPWCAYAFELQRELARLGEVAEKLADERRRTVRWFALVMDRFSEHYELKDE